MFGRMFGKKEPELILADSSDEEHSEPRRPRFRRTRSAASESLYADYVSDDWGDAPTIHVDRHGREVHSRSPDDLDDWQRDRGVFGGVAARMRSLSFSRPNWSRAPPDESPYQYGWAERVERAGGVDERQLKRDEEKSRKPVTMPIPKPAPGPIDVRRDEDPPGLDERPPPGVPLRPPEADAAPKPALVRRGTRASNRPSELGVRVATGHRSTTSSPKVIDHKDLKKLAQVRALGHRHLSRVEKIAAVVQHVTSLPWIADSPVKTYYPPKDKQVIPPVPPSCVLDPSIPKRYLPPPPMPAAWYQPKPPKKKKPKQPKLSKKAEPTKMSIAQEADRFGISDEEFEYPDYYDDYMGYMYTGDTPTLQSDRLTEDSEYDNPMLIQDAAFAEYAPVRPAFFPGPIKSTGLTTTRQPEPQPAGPLSIDMYPANPSHHDMYDAGPHPDMYPGPHPDMYPGPHPDMDFPGHPDLYPPGAFHPDMYPGAPHPDMYPPGAPHPDMYPVIPLHPDMYRPGPSYPVYPPGPPEDYATVPRRLQITAGPEDFDDFSSSSSSSRGPIPSPLTTANGRSIHTRTPVFTADMLPPESYSATTPTGPPLIIPTPTKTPKVMSERTPKVMPQPTPKSMHKPTPKGKAGPLPGGYSPQPYSKHYEAYVPPAKEKGPSPRSAHGLSPKKPKRSPQAQGPSPQAFYPPPPQGYGATPLGRKSSLKGYGPSPQTPFGISPQYAYGPSPQYAYGPSPQYAYGPSPQYPYGLPPQFAYGPSPQSAYGPSPQGIYGLPPHEAPYVYHAQTPQFVWSWGAPPYATAPGEIPPPPPIPGESPPPIPSPIATTTSRSRSRASRR